MTASRRVTNKEVLEAVLSLAERYENGLQELKTEIGQLRAEMDRLNERSKKNEMALFGAGAGAPSLVGRVEKINGLLRGDLKEPGLCDRVDRLESSMGTIKWLARLMVAALVSQLISVALNAHSIAAALAR